MLLLHFKLPDAYRAHCSVWGKVNGGKVKMSVSESLHSENNLTQAIPDRIMIKKNEAQIL